MQLVNQIISVFQNNQNINYKRFNCVMSEYCVMNQKISVREVSHQNEVILIFDKRYSLGFFTHPDNNPCSDCTCGESDNGPEPKCTYEDCQPIPFGCVSQVPPGQCCAEILYCGCPGIGERFYRIGEEVPDLFHIEDPCFICTCVARDAVDCNFMFCDAPPTGCVTQNNPDQCCPEILHCGCEADGKIYKIGDEIPDNDPCSTCTCEASDNGAEPVCWAVECPAYPENCVTQNVPGQCCPEILHCGCEVDGTIYKYDEIIPHDYAFRLSGFIRINRDILYERMEISGYFGRPTHDDPCICCYCDYGEVSCQKGCPYPPPGCENAQPSPGFCCPDYKALGCETSGSSGS
ncbi:CLUMA_CG016751, isoform A [Clunio marinus]|uniref:CLUMA_CG016751, isoform A n=1 Tax=Clunio marinus TaxID=568069 RepID=A0A1J1IVD1_9DIPT|nr:CLUMA_CG016751, isoform A [Clunio marinus]